MPVAAKVHSRRSRIFEPCWKSGESIVTHGAGGRGHGELGNCVPWESRGDPEPRGGVEEPWLERIGETDAKRRINGDDHTCKKDTN